MGQVLHGCATTTKAIRRAIQHSQESLRGLARRYGINPKTVALVSLGTIGLGVSSTGGSPEINLVAADPAQRDERRNGERDGNEHRPGLVGIGDGRHGQRDRDAARSRETLVLSEPFRQRGVADQPKRDSNNRWPDNTPCDPLQHFGKGDRREARPKAEDQGT